MVALVPDHFQTATIEVISVGIGFRTSQLHRHLVSLHDFIGNWIGVSLRNDRRALTIERGVVHRNDHAWPRSGEQVDDCYRHILELSAIWSAGAPVGNALVLPLLRPVCQNCPRLAM